MTKITYLCRAKCNSALIQATSNGAIAQLVEQRTENPCVPGSIPGGTTPPFIREVLARGFLFFVTGGTYERKGARVE